jgi:hypothetical protein
MPNEVVQTQINEILELIKQSEDRIEQLDAEKKSEKDKIRKYNKVLLALKDIS